MATLREIEPFAIGFKEADISNVQPEYERNYRIACGFKLLVETKPLSIRPQDWFVGPGCGYPDLGIYYSRAAGMFYPPDVMERQIAAHPELTDELKALYDEFEMYRTHRFTGGFYTVKKARLREAKCFWGEGGGHANPDYEMLLRLGTNGIREKIKKFRAIHTDRPSFYDTQEIALSCIEILAKRYHQLAVDMLATANEEDAKCLRRIIAALENVPYNRPRDFYEACQFYWLAYSMIDNDSPGLWEYVMDPYYLPHDKADRYECLRKIWQLFYRVRAWNLCLGRTDEFGNCHYSELTLDTLRVAREYKYNTPNITMRFNKNTPDDVWRAAAETLATGIGMPAMYNDDCVCPALEALGIPASDAHLYCMNGCNQIDIFGKSHMGLEDGEFCVSKALEFTLYNGVETWFNQELGLLTGDPTKFASFDEFKEAFYKQCRYLIDLVVETSNMCQEVFAKESPNPWHTNLIQGCLEKGLDYKNRGPIYGHGQILTEGLTDAVDSLIAIKHFVYDEKKYTIAQLVAALKANFEGYDDLYRDFSGYHKFGNDIDDVDNLYGEVSDYLYAYALTKSTWRGGKFGLGCSTFQRSANYGYHLGALPNGKKYGFNPDRTPADTNLSESIGPVPGCDTHGPTATLNSVLHCNQYLATSGNVMQLKFIKNQFATDAGMDAFVALARTYFLRGGQTLQINVVSQEEMIDAMDHPEKHQDLIVRVGGFSAYFVRLEKGLQENIIRRTQQGL